MVLNCVTRYFRNLFCDGASVLLQQLKNVVELKKMLLLILFLNSFYGKM